MMSDPLLELETLAPLIPAAIQAQRLEQALGRAVEKVAEVPRQAARFQALVEAAVRLGVANDTNARRPLQEAVEEAENIGDLLEGARTPEDLQYVSDDFPKLVGALRSLDIVVRQYWRLTVSNEFQSLLSVGDLLTRIPGTQALGTRLRSISQEAQLLAERNPPAEQLAPEIQRLRNTRAQLDVELHQLSSNPDVDAFITAVARDTATLAHVTPPVMDWLQRNDALEAFAVRGAT
jgi:nucleotide-binding universal stress UspA family protein